MIDLRKVLLLARRADIAASALAHELLYEDAPENEELAEALAALEDRVRMLSDIATEIHAELRELTALTPAEPETT
jgi:hypothetical protein